MVSVQGRRSTRRYEKRETVQKFAGLNNELEPDMIRDAEQAELINFNVTPSKVFVKRPGFKNWSNLTTTAGAATKILGSYDTGSGTPQLVATNGSTTVASTDGGITFPTVISATRAFKYSVQYSNLLWLVDSTGVAKWDGTTLTTITGSPGGIHILSFKDRLWVCDGAPSSNLYYSDPGPSGVETWGAASVIKVRTGSPGSLVATLPFADRLMLFKTMTVWQLFLAGNVASWQLRILNSERGAVGENAVLIHQGLIYMLSWDGLWRSDGALFRELSNRIRQYFIRKPFPAVDSHTSLSLCNRRLFICYRNTAEPKVDGLFTCTYLWYHLDADAWSEMRLATGVAKWRPQSIFTWYNPGNLASLPPTQYLVDSWNVDASDLRGIFVLDENVPADKTHPFVSHLRTKTMDFGDVFDMKRCKILMVEMDSTTGALPEVTFYRDNELADIHLVAGGLFVKPHKIHRISGPGYFRQLATVIEESTTAPLRIGSISWVIMIKSTVGPDT